MSSERQNPGLERRRWILAGLSLLGTGLSLYIAFAPRIVSHFRPGPSDARRAAMPSCFEAEGPTGERTLIWRAPMDRPPNGRIERAVATVDRATKVEGRGSVLLTATGPARFRFGHISLLTFRFGRPFEGGTLLLRARLRTDEALAGRAFLAWSIQGAQRKGPRRVVPEVSDPPVGPGGWHTLELVHPVSSEDARDSLDLELVTLGPGKVWIDDLELLRGPRDLSEGGPGYPRLAADRRLPPASEVDVYYRALTSRGRDESDAWDALTGVTPDFVPPDAVQRCLTEALLWQVEDRHSFIQRVLEIFRGDRDLAWLGYRSERIARYYQPDYLERLVAADPSEDLVDTYGRKIVPHALAHGVRLLGLPKSACADLPLALRGDPSSTPGPRDFMRSSRRTSFARMIGRLAEGANDGRWEITAAERAGLVCLLETRFEIEHDSAEKPFLRDALLEAVVSLDPSGQASR